MTKNEKRGISIEELKIAYMQSTFVPKDKRWPKDGCPDKNCPRHYPKKESKDD